MDGADELTFLSRSERPSVTEKMLAYQMEDQAKKEKRLLNLYEQWEIKMRKSKEDLKRDISEPELATMADITEKGMNDIMRAYHDLRERATPSTELRRKIDPCEAVSKVIMKIIIEC